MSGGIGDPSCRPAEDCPHCRSQRGSRINGEYPHHQRIILKSVSKKADQVADERNTVLRVDQRGFVPSQLPRTEVGNACRKHKDGIHDGPPVEVVEHLKNGHLG
jgi:hypothetical protein